MRDAYSNVNNISDQGRRIVQITPNDSTDLNDVPKALLCTVAGNVSIVAVEGNFQTDNSTAYATAIVVPLVAGQVFDAVRCKRILATNTTATVVGIL